MTNIRAKPDKKINSPVKNMHYPAATSFAMNPPFRLVGPIGTGHWVARQNYGTIRHNGTGDWLIIYTASGSGRVAFKEHELITGPGDIVAWPPRTPHDYRLAPGSDSWEMLWAHVHPWPHWHELLNWPDPQRGFRHLHIADTAMRAQIYTLLDEMNDYTNGPLANRELFAINALEKALLLCDTVNPSSRDARFDTRIRKALDYLCANISGKVLLEEAGRACGLSASRLSHLFRKQVGVTPVQYLEQQRMKRARDLLEHTAFSVSEISLAAGFESPFYFSRRFRKYTGASPRQYRAGKG